MSKSHGRRVGEDGSPGLPPGLTAQAQAVAASNNRIRSREGSGPQSAVQGHSAHDQDMPGGQNRLSHRVERAPEVPIEEVPPPVYSETYGRVDMHQSGLSTIASVAENGRVDIKISEESHIVSNLLVPALRSQMKIQNKERPYPHPSSFVPPSLGGLPGQGTPPPPMNVVIHVVGSRGDVQPFVALGRVLKDTYGHRVRLATHPTFRDFITENGLEFFSIGGDPAELMAFMVKNPGLMPGNDALRKGDIGKRRKGMYEIVQGCWRSCFEAGDGTGIAVTDSQPRENFDITNKPFVADAIIANPPSFSHVHCAEKLGIPLHMMFTMPWSPTQSFPHPLANIQASSTDISMTNFLSYVLVELMTWQGLGDVINRFRENSLGLEPLSLMWAPGMASRLRVPYTYCWSPALIPKPKDWGAHISISGFYFLSLAKNYHPASDLATFLESGAPPVYIGFGSIVVDDPDKMTRLIFDAVKKTGQRALVSKGWGGLGADSMAVPDDIFMLGNVPHDWLFKHVSCVVHHGGAGTTAAGIALGKPTVVVPFFGDQPFWGAMVARAGAGPDPIPNKEMTSDGLAAAISMALEPSTLERAKELGARISSEKGSDVGAKAFHDALDIEGMRCNLAPGRAAVWRAGRSGINLSALAAAVLGNEGLLDFSELELHRPKEWDTEDAPWDPIGGAASALAGTIGSLMMGAADIPVEMFKLFSSKKSTPKSTTAPQNSDSSSLSSQPSPPDNNLKANRNSNLTSQKDDTPALNKAPIQPITMESAVDAGRGIGRMIDAGLKSPMDFTLALAKGFHNAPKLYGDDTVRPAERVTDFQSGIKAAGKGFGFGFYDGISGLVTQPIEGAKKEGFAGLVKGFGKGLGGVVLKPGAAVWGVPGYTFKGIYKEIRKHFGSSVQNYIIAARTAQGYNEWRDSSESERTEIISRWSVVSINNHRQRNSGRQSPSPTNTLKEYAGKATSTSGSASTRFSNNSGAQSAGGGAYEGAIRDSVEATSKGNAEEDAMIERAIRASVAELQRRPVGNDEDDEDSLARAIKASLAEASKLRSREPAEVSAKNSISENKAGVSAVNQSRPERQDDRTVNPDDDENIKQALLASQQHEDTTRQEEEIVMNYIKQQSLEEARHKDSMGK